MPNLVHDQSHSYATYTKALRVLELELHKAGQFELSQVRYLIASTPTGRFVPVLVGEQYIPFAFTGKITVVN